MTDTDVADQKSTENAAETSAPLSAVQEVPLDERPLTERQRRLEDKRKLVEAMNSGLIPVYDEPEYLPQEQPKASVEEPQDDQDFEPCTFFLYGTLMDPEVLMVVAMLGNLPQLQDAWIEGFEMKMWNGIYPTLLPNEGAQGRISGKAWQANTMAQCLRLQRYETSAYEVADCRIHLGEDELVKGLVFKWAKDPKSAELADGAFDLDHWQRTHKTSLF